MSKYRIRRIDAPIVLPKKLGKTYTTFEKAYIELSNFVHSFCGKLKVDGAVYDIESDEDIEYVTSYWRG